MKEQEDKEMKLLKWVVVIVIGLLIIGLGLAILYNDEIQQLVDEKHNITQINQSLSCIDNCVHGYMQNRTVNDCIDAVTISFQEICMEDISPLNCSQGQEALEQYIIPYCIEFTEQYLYNVSQLCTQGCNENATKI